jgi:hypothetical protein
MSVKEKIKGRLKRMTFTRRVKGAVFTTGFLITLFIVSPFMLWAASGQFDFFLAILFWGMAGFQLAPLMLLFQLAEMEYVIRTIEDDEDIPE